MNFWTPWIGHFNVLPLSSSLPTQKPCTHHPPFLQTRSKHYAPVLHLPSCSEPVAPRLHVANATTPSSSCKLNHGHSPQRPHSNNNLANYLAVHCSNFIQTQTVSSLLKQKNFYTKPWELLISAHAHYCVVDATGLTVAILGFGNMTAFIQIQCSFFCLQLQTNGHFLVVVSLIQSLAPGSRLTSSSLNGFWLDLVFYTPKKSIVDPYLDFHFSCSVLNEEE